MTTSSPSTPSGALPPGLALYRMAIGHYVSRALDLAARLRLADLIAEGSRDVAQLAAASEANEGALRRVLRLLASVGVLEEREGGCFALTDLGQLLRSDVPGSMRDSVMLFAGVGMQDRWRDLEYCVRSGEPAFRRSSPDADPFTEMARDPEQAAQFDRAMATFAPQTAAALAAGYDFSRFPTLVDVGGGNGALLIGLLRANPGIRGIVFDQPHVAERARQRVKEADLERRCEVIGGSFFEAVPAGADAYLLKHVIHDWNDERAGAILRTCRRAMAPGARLLLVEGVYPARIDRSPESQGAAANDVNMLVCTGGRQRSEAEFRELLAAGGFRLARVVPTPARVSVIEGEPA
jgi:orsellinic acid C2-O-methyltransferase